jgi:hypothetical protein
MHLISLFLYPQLLFKLFFFLLLSLFLVLLLLLFLFLLLFLLKHFKPLLDGFYFLNFEYKKKKDRKLDSIRNNERRNFEEKIFYLIFLFLP